MKNTIKVLLNKSIKKMMNLKRYYIGKLFREISSKKKIKEISSLRCSKEEEIGRKLLKKILSNQELNEICDQRYRKNH
jgi:hypothetical protein